MKIAKEALIEDLIDKTRANINEGEALRQQDAANLNWKAAPNQWSVLECIEHLNRYGDFYLPEIDKRIKGAKPAPASVLFRSGLLGNYFAKSMLPKEQLNKMKTFKSMNPLGSKLDKSTLVKFISQQKTMLDLLERARAIDLSKTKTAISISSFIKLRLGDTFRIVIYHNVRHMVQARRVLKERSLQMEVVK